MNRSHSKNTDKVENTNHRNQNVVSLSQLFVKQLLLPQHRWDIHARYPGMGCTQARKNTRIKGRETVS
jgi:hypothetical protein